MSSLITLCTYILTLALLLIAASRDLAAGAQWPLLLAALSVFTGGRYWSQRIKRGVVHPIEIEDFPPRSSDRKGLQWIERNPWRLIPSLLFVMLIMAVILDGSSLSAQQAILVLQWGVQPALAAVFVFAILLVPPPLDHNAKVMDWWLLLAVLLVMGVFALRVYPRLAASIIGAEGFPENTVLGVVLLTALIVTVLIRLLRLRTD